MANVFPEHRSLTTVALLTRGLLALLICAGVVFYAQTQLNTLIREADEAYTQRTAAAVAKTLGQRLNQAMSAQAALQSPTDISPDSLPLAEQHDLIDPADSSNLQDRYNFVVQDMVNRLIAGEKVHPEAVRDDQGASVYWATRLGEQILLVQYGSQLLSELRQALAAVDGQVIVSQTLSARSAGIPLLRYGLADPLAPSSSSRIHNIWLLTFQPSAERPQPDIMTLLLPWGLIMAGAVLALLVCLAALYRYSRLPGAPEPEKPTHHTSTETAHPHVSHPLPYENETVGHQVDLPDVEEPEPETDPERQPADTEQTDKPAHETADCVIPQHIFRAYDIRGLVDAELSNEVMHLLGRALGSEVRSRGFERINLAWDGRLSSERLANHLQEGLLHSGCSVNRLGMLPTGALYWATHELDSSCGVMITGSHNPIEYNGLKIVIDRTPMAEDELLSLWYRVQREEFTTGYAGAREQDIYSDYIERIENDIQINKDLTIVLDAGNGVAGPMAADLFRELGAEVIELFCDIDGRFPNHHPDPGELENLESLRESVLTHKADLGLAFDGDGDRVAVLDNEGNVIFPDRLLMLLIEDILPRKPGSDVIFDVKSSRHIAPMVNRLGGKPTMWKTGHSLMKRKLKELKASVAGEFSGHFYIGERWYGFDCGLYSGARIVEILSNRRATAAEVFAALPEDTSTPEITLNTTEDRKFSLITQLSNDVDLTAGAIVHTTDGLRIEFSDGWGLVRASNTTPRLTLRFAGDSQATIDRIQATMKQALTRYAPEIKTPF